MEVGKTMLSTTGIKLQLTHCIIMILSLIFLHIFQALSFASTAPLPDVLTKGDRDWLREHAGTIKIGVLKNEPGFFVTDKDGNRTGIANEYIKLIEQKLQFKFRYLEYDNWHNMLAALYEGKIDTVNFISHTKKRAKRLLFTEPYYQYPYMLVSKNRKVNEANMHQLQGKSIAIPRQYAVADYLTEYYPNLNIITKNSYSSCVLAVVFDKVDVTLGSAIITTELIQKHNLTGISISELRGFPNEHRFAVRKEMAVFRSVLDKGLQLITKAEHEYLYSKWIKLESKPFYKSKTFWTYCAGLCLLVIIGIRAVFFWNWKLQQAVRKQTRELEKNTERLKEEAYSRKEAERILLEQEAYLWTILESIPDMIWIKDPEGLYIKWNRRFEEFFGICREQIINQSSLPFIDKEQAEKWKKSDHEVLEKSPGGFHRNIDQIYGHDKRQCTFEILKTSIHDVNNELIGVLSIARDISRHQLKQEELLSFQRLFNSILENIQGFTYRRVADGNMTMCSSGYYLQTITGYPLQDFTNNRVRSYKSVIHPEDYPLVSRAISSAMCTGKAWDIKYRLLCRDKSARWVREKGTLSVDRETGKQYQDGLVIDITSQREIEEMFRQTQKMEAIGVLSDGIAHDFNNILGGMLGYAELLEENLPSLDLPKNAHNRLRHILVTIGRAKELVSQILEFGKLGNSGLKPLNIKSIAKEVSKLFITMFPGNITVTTNLANECTILADTTKIHQLLMNLGTNGCHAMKETGGTLTISTREVSLCIQDVPEGVLPGNFLQLSVSDTGIGMEETVQEKILRPFYTTKPKGEGTGMGLWLVKRIVKDLNGFMRVSSVVGEGSTFTVYLPIFNKVDGSAETASIVENFSWYEGTEHILYVDDEKTLTQLAGIFLTKFGYRVTPFTSPVAAFASFEKDPTKYDLVITDMSMPEISGDLLLKRMRKIRPEMKVVLTTGFQINPQSCSSFNRALIKPVSLSTMIQTVRETLDE